MDSREAFERAVKNKWSDSYSFDREAGNDYTDEILEGMWWGWQASRQASEGEPVAYEYQWAGNDRIKAVCKPEHLPTSGDDLIITPLYAHPASAKPLTLGQRKAAQIGPVIGVLAQDQDGRVCAVTDLGRCTWLNQDVTGAGDGAHNCQLSRAMDGTCIKCDQSMRNPN